MPQIPRELRAIILDYLDSFYVVLSLPRLKCVKKLIRQSNQDIIDRFHVRKIIHSGGFITCMSIAPCLEMYLSNPLDLHLLAESVGSSLRNCIHSSALKWIILDKRLYDYERYKNAFLKSYMFRVFNRLEL